MSAVMPTERASAYLDFTEAGLNAQEPANPAPNASCVPAGAVDLGKGVGWASRSSGLLGIKLSRKYIYIYIQLCFLRQDMCCFVT